MFGIKHNAYFYEAKDEKTRIKEKDKKARDIYPGVLMSPTVWPSIWGMDRPWACCFCSKITKLAL